MNLTTFAQQVTGKSFDDLFVSAKLVRFSEREDGTIGVSYWDASLGKPPTDAQVAAALAAPEPAPLPDIISRRQFAQQAAVQGSITQDEALAWAANGTIPSEMLALIAQALPASAQFQAKMMLVATTFDRTNSLTTDLVTAFGWTPAQRDAFWTAAAAL